MPQIAKVLYEFGAYRIDARQGVLYRQHERVYLTPKAFETLLALVEAGGEIVDREALLARVWPGTFVEEGSLSRNISVLRKALSAGDSSREWIETIPKRGYRFIPPQSPLPALAVEPVEAPPAHSPSRRRWLQAAVSGVVLLAAGLGVWWWMNWWPSQSVSSPIRSIAVLPFENTSGDPSQDFLAAGTTDELIANLAQIHSLRVSSRTSSEFYKGTRKKLPEIAKELGVDAIVEGSVERDGNRVRIHAQLIRASTDAHIWAQEYERQTAGVLQLQGEVARAIVREIRAQVTTAEEKRLARSQSTNAEAQEAYLLGQYHVVRRNERDLKLAIEHFEHAIQLDPNFAAAYGKLSEAWASRGVFGSTSLSEVKERTLTAGRKALALDPNLAEAHAVLGWNLAIYDWDWVGSEAELRRAIDLDPSNLDAHRYYGSLLLAWGRPADGVAEAERLLALDPVSSLVQSDVGRIYYRARRHKDAEMHLLRAIELDPQDFGAYSRLGDVYAVTGRDLEAVALLDQGLRGRSPDFRGFLKLAEAYVRAGQRDKGQRIFDRYLILNKSSNYNIALVYLALGDRDRFIECLTRALYGEISIFLKSDPRFDSVRSDPRFQALVARLKIAD